MTDLRSARNVFLGKLIELDLDQKIDWTCDRNNSTISGKVGDKIVSISETAFGMGLKSYQVSITDSGGLILDIFTPHGLNSAFGNFDSSSEDQNDFIFGLDRHSTDINVRKLYQGAMSKFFSENLEEILSEMNEL